MLRIEEEPTTTAFARQGENHPPVVFDRLPARVIEPGEAAILIPGSDRHGQKVRGESRPRRLLHVADRLAKIVEPERRRAEELPAEKIRGRTIAGGGTRAIKRN